MGVAGGETDEIVPDWWIVEHASQVRLKFPNIIS